MTTFVLAGAGDEAEKDEKGLDCQTEICEFDRLCVYEYCLNMYTFVNMLACITSGT